MKKRGKGIACMYYPIGSTGKPNPGSAMIKVNHDGTVIVYVGAVDEGQGSTTALAQIVAEEIGVPFKSVRLVTADTELTPYDNGTGACRVTYVVGNAVKEAAEKAKMMLLEAAAIKFKVIDHRKLVICNGKISMKGFPDLTMSVKDAAWMSERVIGKPILSTASFTPAVTALDPVTGHGKAYENHIFSTQIAEVEVDVETGEVEILRLIAVHDCGTAINPLIVEGQIEGGVIMGCGFALTEDYLENPKNGMLASRSFTDYKLPTFRDMPGELIVDIIEIPEEEGPFGAKGIGEPTLLTTAPAIINAIYDAIGVQIKELPATPEKILAALKMQAVG